LRRHYERDVHNLSLAEGDELGYKCGDVREVSSSQLAEKMVGDAHLTREENDHAKTRVFGGVVCGGIGVAGGRGGYGSG
jgi:hypothetical protein